ncbi:hypothetical protein [Domibacillus iocasae]|uniref:S-layer protein n=1 Tax=Domibacillus iocasae TaxID=1714016 RepID=A0A1E7DPB4_9BACI|nr:hypothetical protein [Domibacillus iocasae]OES44922.1 hypothetical protein BA724_06575 [Domibacillus iocasae]
MKKAFLLLFTMMMTGCTAREEVEPAQEKIRIALGSQALHLEAEELRMEKERSPEGIASLYEDTVYELDAGAADVTVNVRKLHNGDRFVMLRLDGSGTLKGTISIPEADDYYLVDWAKNMPVREPGTDLTKPPVGLLRYTQNYQFVNEIVVSHAFTSKTLTELYGKGRASTLQELVAEENNAILTKNGVQFELEADRGQRAEQWFLIAQKPLFDDTDRLNEWITFQKEQEAEVNNWFTVDGPLKKMSAVEPATQKGYGYDLETMIEGEAIGRFLKSKDRYFYNITVQSAANLWTYRQSRNDLVWKTNVTSTALKKKYGLTSPYVDMRDNERIARYLHQVGEELDVPELKGVLGGYSDYLLDLISIGNTVPAENGYYPADYYSPYQKKAVLHASLDQALGESSLLLAAYKETGEKKYVEAARSIRDAVESTGEKWIRPNGNLWNQIHRDGTFTAEGNDLQVLQSLRNREKNWQELGGSPSPILQKLIESKEQYLNSK